MPDPTYDVKKFINVGTLKTALEAMKNHITTAGTDAADAFHSASIVNNTVNFYTSSDQTGVPVFSFDFPSELVLDQLKTKFEHTFEWSDDEYPNSTDPDLDGEPVLVLAVKDTNGGNVTTTYSFLNMADLVDTYSAADNTITISNYTVKVKVSSKANNAIVVENDGLHVDVSSKAARDVDAVQGNIAMFDNSGNPIDSGAAIATQADITAMLTEVWGS